MRAQSTAAPGRNFLQHVPRRRAAVSLRARAGGNCVTAENGGADALVASRTGIGGWEQFDLVTG